jgi:hypothetical protein
MIDKEILIMKLRDFSINYDIPLKDEYIGFIANELNAEGFTNDEFVCAVRTINRTCTTTFGKMPNLAMFLEARPRKPYNSYAGFRDFTAERLEEERKLKLKTK